MAENNYVVGRGKLYFDRFADGTRVGEGFMYFGNTPELTLSQSLDSLEHYSSDEGLKVKDASVDLSNSQTGSFTCDNISTDNLALFFLGSASVQTIASATGSTETISDVKYDRYYQVGRSDVLPQGLRGVTMTTVKIGVTGVAASGNWEFNEDTGMLHVLPDATDIDEGDDLILTYNVTASTRTMVIGQNSTIYGALKFVSANPQGRQKDYTWPYVKLSPNGDLNLKGDDWQTVGFGFDILKLSDAVERVYIDDRAA